jgi:hypothetical protein
MGALARVRKLSACAQFWLGFASVVLFSYAIVVFCSGAE